MGRPVKQLDEPKNFLAPFPETVMVQLAKGVLAADNGASDPTLLSEDFTFCAPIVGPLDKDTFVKAFSGFGLREAFPDSIDNSSNFRVDPYDPYRVWFDTKARGTWTGGQLLNNPANGKMFQSPPEVASYTFDDDGFCTRMTAGYVMDPTD